MEYNIYFKKTDNPIGAARQKTVHRIYESNRCLPSIQLYTPLFAMLVSGSRWTNTPKLKMVSR